MQTKIDTSLIEAAQQIAPIVAKHSEEAERERRLSRPVLDALREAGLMRMMTPRSLGGLETDPITRALVVEEISRHDSAAGWTLERMPAVDRNLLRMAIGEMLAFKSTPFPIVINEALEIGRRYCAPESINFLNGILDAIAHSLLPK